VRRLLEIALPLPYRSRELRLAWSLWRRAKRLQARHSHYRRQMAASDGWHCTKNAANRKIYGCSTGLRLKNGELNLEDKKTFLGTAPQTG
jgi:hypothetical protein